MSRFWSGARRGAVRAAAFGLVALVAAVAAMVTAVLLQGVVVPGYATPQPYEIVSISVFLLVAPILGAVLVARVPRNPIGWLFIAVPAVLSIGFATEGYSMWARHVAGDLGPTPDLVSTFGGAVSGLGFGGTAVIALLFPSGTLPSSRWRPVLWLVIGGQLGLAAGAFRADNSSPGLTNLLAVAGLAPLFEVLEFAGTVATIGAFAAGALALALRYRRARGVERQQIKWFAFAAGLTAVLLFFATLAPTAIADAFWVSAISSLALWPIAAAIAILRYRLYDIDLLINRTIVYTGLTAALGATFFGGLVLLQGLLRPITGATELGVALSTLVSFTLFQPLRRAIQTAVDQRFNRRTYDAERTVDAFSSRLSDEIDLDALRGDLVAVVRNTMAPAHVSVWLRRRES